MATTLAGLALVSNLVLVAITAWYAWQTYETVREMRESRRAAVRPNVRLDLESIGSHVLAKIENVGSGPALDVNAAVTIRTTSGATDRLDWRTPVLRPGESRLLNFPRENGPTPFTFAGLRESGAQLLLDGTCKSTSDETLSIDDALTVTAETRNEVTVSSSTDVSERLKKIADTLAAIHKAMPSAD